MTPHFVAAVSILLPIYCHIGLGMPYLCFFVLEVVTLLGAITEKWVRVFVCGLNKNSSDDEVKVSAKHINAIYLACELWVERVGTLGVLLYRNQ